MPDQPKKPRFGTRRVDDDDEVEDERPRKKNKDKNKGTPVGLILGGGVLRLLLLACCGIGGYFVFLGDLGFGNHFTITKASLSSGGRNTNINIEYDMKSNVDPSANYVVVVRGGGVTYDVPLLTIGMAPGAKAQLSYPIPNWPATNPGPYEVWIEKRSGSSKSKVSNSLKFY